MSGNKDMQEWSFTRSFIQAAIVISLISILLYLGWFYLDHADEIITNPAKAEFTLLGRIREIKSGPVLIFDDGTAVISIHWLNQETAPALKSIIFVKAVRNRHRLVGQRRFTLK